MSPDESINSVVNLLDALPSAPDKYQALLNLKTAVFAIHPSALHRVTSVSLLNADWIVFD